jgi:transposase-like protein
MTTKRRSYTATEKADAVRMHLADKKPVSDIAEQLNIHTTVIHGWIRAALAQIERAFDDPRSQAAAQRNDKKQIDKLKARIDQKNEVIAELMQENIQAKKDNGEL